MSSARILFVLQAAEFKDGATLARTLLRHHCYALFVQPPCPLIATELAQWGIVSAELRADSTPPAAAACGLLIQHADALTAAFMTAAGRCGFTALAL